MPLNANIDGQIRSDKHKYKENKYITKEQARHVYKKVESSNIINVNTLKQEIEKTKNYIGWMTQAKILIPIEN